MGRKEQDERKGRRGEKRFQREGDEKVSEQTIHTHITYEGKRNRKIMRKGHCQKVGKKTGRFSLRKKEVRITEESSYGKARARSVIFRDCRASITAVSFSQR